LLIPLPTEGKENINIRLTGRIQRKGKKNIFQSFNFASPRLSIPCLQSSINIYYPEEYELFHRKGNFEEFPETEHQRPVLTALFKGLSSSLLGNMADFFSLGFYSQRALQGRLRSASDDIGDQFSVGNSRTAMQYEPYYLTTDYDVVRGEAVPQRLGERNVPEEMDSRRTRQSSGFQQSSYDPAALSVQQGLVRWKYKKKKGVLSLNINVPKQGKTFATSKLWGNSRLTATFIPHSSKRILTLVFALLFIALGFFLKKKEIMSPFGFLIMVLALGSLLPLVLFKSLMFMYNGAVLGALTFAGILIVLCCFKKILSKYGISLFLIFFLLPAIDPAQKTVMAQEQEAFPDIKIYVPYEKSSPLNLKNADKLYIPTEDYFRLKVLAEPPYKPQDSLKYEDSFNITGLNFKGALEGDRINFNATVDIFVNTDKWVLVDLPFRNVAIEKFKLDGKAIAVQTKKSPPIIYQQASQSVGSTIFDPKIFPPVQADIYELPILGFGHHSLELSFNVAVNSLPGKKILAFGFPKSLMADFTLNLGSKDVFVQFEYPRNGFYIDEEGKTSVVNTSLSGKSHLILSWFPKKFLKKEEKPLIYVDCDINMFLGYEEVHLEQQTTIRVEKSSIASMNFQMDPKLMIVDIYSDKVKSWKTKEAQGETFVEVLFKHEITNTAALTIKAKYRARPGETVPALLLKPVEAKRNQGLLNLFAL